METTHWADWADTFKLQDAACLIAGVSAANEMVAWADKLPPEARPVFKKLWNSYLRGTGFYKRPAPDSVDFPKMLHGIPAEDFRAPTVASARGVIRRQEMLVAPSAELMIKRLENVSVSREELCRWVKAMGIKSAYLFLPQQAVTQTQAAPAQQAGTEPPPAPDAPADTKPQAAPDAPVDTVAPVTTITPAVALLGASVVSKKGDWPAMPKLAWSEISIAISGGKYESESGLGANSMLHISARDQTNRIPLATLGLADGRNGSPNKVALILVAMADGKGKRNVTSADRHNLDRIKVLTKSLREYFGIKERPFVCQKRIYVPQFTLTDNRGKTDERAEREARLRTVSAERMKEQGCELSDNSADASAGNNPGDDWAKQKGVFLDPIIED